MNSNPGGLFSGRPALTSLVFYASGIIIGGYLPLWPVVFFAISVALIIAAIILHQRVFSGPATAAILMVLVLVGIAQYQFSISGFPPTQIKNIAEYGGNVTILGRVAAEPDIRSDKTYLIVEVDSATWRSRQIESSGKIIVKLKKTSTLFSYDDNVRFKGYLFAPGGARNPGGFDYARWLSYQEVFGMVVLDSPDQISRLPESDDMVKHIFPGRFFINRIIVPVRRILLDGYDRYLPAEQAALLAGFVLGEKRAMSDAIVKLFSDTGTLHLMAVSGSNVAVVAGFFLVLLSAMNRRIKIIITLAAIIFFSFLTRSEPSVVRAAVMASVGLIGFYRQRNPDVIGLLGFAGLVLLIFKPLWLFNIGFQLSFAACAGIVYFVPIIAVKIKKGNSLWLRLAYWPLMAMLTTLAAQIAVLPLTAEYFNRLPLIGILANLPMIILAGALTIAGFCYLPFLYLGDAAATIFAWPLSKMMSIILPLLNYFASLPHAVINIGSPGILKIAIFFCGLYFLAELVFVKRLSFKALAVMTGVLAIGIWLSYGRGPGSESLSFIDCGPDRAILYSDPDGNRYLWYDCYESDGCKQLESSLLPYVRRQGISRIETLFTNDSIIVCNLEQDLEIGKILNHKDIGKNLPGTVKDFSPYKFTESILNKGVKFVCVETDNNTETLTEGCFYEISTGGGEFILAGQLPSHLAGEINRPMEFIELPWSCQAYGTVFKRLSDYPPRLLIFSPDKGSPAMVKYKNKLTYLENRTWATSIYGSFRIRFEAGRAFIDYMIEP